MAIIWAIAFLCLQSVSGDSKFFVVSDIHYDIFYNENYNSTYLCHEVGSTYNDLTPEPTLEVAPLGRVSCDSPLILVEKTIEEMARVNSNPEFILIPGDIIGHFTSSALNPEGNYDSDYNDEMIIKTFQEVNTVLRKYFPNTPILPVLGNNDAYKDYEILPPRKQREFLEKVSAIFTDLPSEFNAEGYYTKKLLSYELVGLNSNFFSLEQRWHRLGARRHLKWLQKTLEESEGDVILMMHIPPGLNRFKFGTPVWKKRYIDRFLDIIKENQDKIAFMFTGHYHSATFQIIGNTGPIVHIAVSPIFGNNPAFREYIIEGEKQDYIDHSLDILKDDPKWKVEVKHSEFFGYDSIDLVKDYDFLKNSDKKLLEYMIHAYAFGHSDVSLNYLWSVVFHVEYDSATDKGYGAALCSIEHVKTSDYDKCLEGF